MGAEEGSLTNSISTGPDSGNGQCHVDAGWWLRRHQRVEKAREVGLWEQVSEGPRMTT